MTHDPARKLSRCIAFIVLVVGVVATSLVAITEYSFDPQRFKARPPTLGATIMLFIPYLCCFISLWIIRVGMVGFWCVVGYSAWVSLCGALPMISSCVWLAISLSPPDATSTTLVDPTTAAYIAFVLQAPPIAIALALLIAVWTTRAETNETGSLD